MAVQAEKYTFEDAPEAGDAEPKVHRMNAELTMGENLADLGGMSLACKVCGRAHAADSRLCPSGVPALACRASPSPRSRTRDLLACLLHAYLQRGGGRGLMEVRNLSQFSRFRNFLVTALQFSHHFSELNLTLPDRNPPRAPLLHTVFMHAQLKCPHTDMCMRTCDYRGQPCATIVHNHCFVSLRT